MRLFFYILREYIKYVLGTVCLTLFLFILFDFIHKTTKYFAKYEAETGHILQFYLYQLPAQFVQALPIASLLASVVTMVLLSRTNEITAMRAAGMSPSRIGLPLAAGGGLLSLLSLGVGEFVVPAYAQKMHYVQEVQIEGESNVEIAEGAQWFRDGEKLVHFKDYNPITQTLEKVRIVDVGSNFRPRRSLEAREGVFNRENGTWTLSGIKVMGFKPNGNLDSISRTDRRTITLPVEPAKLKKERRDPNELSLRQLREMIQVGESSGKDVLPYKVDFHVKFAYPFAAFVVSLIGLKFGYRSERATETAKGILLAFAIGISYWFILSAGRALGRRGDLPPFVAAWMANVLVLVFVLVDAWRSRRIHR